MAIGIQTGVSPYQDFDDLFEQRISGDPTVSTTGIQTSGGTDISERYVPLSFGGTALPNDTGVQNSAGVDCRDLFAAINTVSRWDGTVEDVPSLIQDDRPEGNPFYALAEILFFADGTIRTRNATTETTVGRWDGVVADSTNTEVYFEVLSSSITVDGDPDVWLQVNATRAVSIETTSNATQNANIRVRLREIGRPSTEITADVVLSARYGALL